MSGRRRKIHALIQKLGNRHPHIRRHAVKQLAAAGNLHLLLAEALRCPDPAVRAGAAQALGSTGNPDSIGLLCLALRDRNTQVRKAAATALSTIASHHPMPELQVAVPRLRQLASRWSDDYLDYLQLLSSWLPSSEEERQVYRLALETIESATTASKDLPLPAAAPLPSPENLPVPAAPPARGQESLPIPAEVAAPRPADGGSERSARPVWPGFLRRWRSRFECLLHRRGPTA